MAKKFKIEVTPTGQTSEQVIYSNPFQDNSQEALKEYLNDAYKVLEDSDVDIIFLNGVRIAPKDYSNIKISIVDEDNKYVSL